MDWDWAALHFIRPWLLLALLPVMALAVLLWRSKLQQGLWSAVCDEALLPYLLQHKAVQPAKGLFGAGVLAGVLAVFALAGPTWRQLPMPVFRNASAVVIALDLSLSMDAQDIKPSRLVRARYKIADLLKQRQDGQTALLVYAGAAFTVTPLTDDVQTIASQLSALTTDIMPSAGSDTPAAIAKAVELLKQAGLPKGQIVLVTDGIDGRTIPQMVKALSGYQLSVLGVGTPDGAPIPEAGGGFVKDRQGGIIIPKLAAGPLAELAQAGQGIYQTISADDGDIKNLQALLGQASQQDGKASNGTIPVWDDKGPWLLLLILPVVALGFRKGVLAIGMLALLPLPQNSYAGGWQDAWQSPDQQAQAQYRQQHYSEAARQFTDKQWQAAAHYQAGEYDKAVEAYQADPQAGNADYFYNLGNALAQSGQLEAALKSYEQALAIKPDDADTLYAKDLVAKELAKLKPENPQDKQDKQDKQDGQSSPQDKSQQSQSQGQNQEQSQDQGQEKQGSTENEQKPPQKPEHPDQPEVGQPDQKPQKSPNQDAKGQTVPDSKAAAPKPDAEQSKQAKDLGSVESAEQHQAEEQWLKRIPDDPAGLLKRKFKYQYGRGGQPSTLPEKEW
ncbi:VWA domain-containing protein [Methylovulum psychrotolerans]|uniref:VWFA domain-containing protein n=1 Tax=Methylovulum psychrotolerans TaxID=1704499 RepID=A0A1Z4C1K9_9GAMM|nr:VWA domain-containing protein [Methylovulum psychrotolerans]ASF47400.1 hypothetical protein CEK71_15760 [Methylovulum psychrotolerans]